MFLSDSERKYRQFDCLVFFECISFPLVFRGQFCFFRNWNCIGLKRSTILIEHDACTHAVWPEHFWDYSNCGFSALLHFWQGCTVSKSLILLIWVARPVTDSTNKPFGNCRSRSLLSTTRKEVNKSHTQLTSHLNTWSCNWQFSLSASEISHLSTSYFVRFHPVNRAIETYLSTALSSLFLEQHAHKVGSRSQDGLEFRHGPQLRDRLPYLNSHNSCFCLHNWRPSYWTFFTTAITVDKTDCLLYFWLFLVNYVLLVLSVPRTSFLVFYQ